MRGIATGANDFFFLTQARAEYLGIPDDFLKTAVGRTRDVTGEKITFQDIQVLEELERPTRLLSIPQNCGSIPPRVLRYLAEGEAAGLPDRALIKQRTPWFKMESRKIPSILFSYLGRRTIRFIRNDAGVLPLTGFLCVYPNEGHAEFANRLCQALNHQDTIKNIPLVAKSYGAEAMKVEPRNLERLPIPEAIVDKFKLSGLMQPSLL